MADVLTDVRLAGTPEANKQQIANLVIARKQHSENYYTGVRRELPQLYDLYRGVQTGRFSPHKNNIHIPLIFSTIQSDVARKVQTSFGTLPFVSFVGYGPDDAPVARKREALIHAQMKDLGIFKKAYEVFLTADLYGTAVIRWGWDHREQDMRVERYDRMPLSGEIMKIVDKKRITIFDGPNFVVKDLLDCFPQPGYRNIDEMQWFCEVDYMDFDEVRALSQMEMGGGYFFDPAEVSRLQSEASSTTELDVQDYKGWRTQARTQMETDGRQRERYARPVKMITMWGKIPDELAPDGLPHRVITVANGTFVLRNRPNPFWNGKKPLLAFSPMYDPHFFFAPGKAEVAKKLQVLANRFTNQQLDALEIFIDPIFFINQNSGLDTRNLFLRPGKFIEMDGNPNEMVSPMQPNLQGIQFGSQMTESAWRWMQQGSGIIEDTIMGGGGGRQTAREFLGRSEAVATRLMMESRLFEETFLEPLADTFVDLNRQFLEEAREVFILGDNATKDPVTGQPIQMTRQMVEGWDLVANYEAHAVGSLTRLARSQRQQTLIFLIQAMSQNPQIAAAVNWINFFRDTLREFEIANLNEILNTPEQMQQMMQAAKGQAQQQPTSTPMGTPYNTTGGGGTDLSAILSQTEG
jgi:hypothetical protein